jgi:organic radical activating enzyme
MIYLLKKISFYPTLNCNYDCWFCNRHFYEDSINYNSNFDKISNFINIIKDKNNFTLKINGGEPTQSSYFYNIFENIYASLYYIITNLSCDLKNIEKIDTICKKQNSNYNIDATFHAQYADPNEFYEKIEYLYNKKTIDGIHFTFENIDYEYIKEKYYPLYCKIRENFLDINIYINSYNDSVINKKIKNIFIDKFCFIENNINNIISQRSFYCYKNYISIDYNGDVFPCCSLISQKKSILPLYNILSTNSILLHNYYMLMKHECKSKWCSHII